MPQKHRSRPVKGRLGCDLLPDASHSPNTLSAWGLQAHLQAASWDELTDDRRFEQWRRMAGFGSLADVLALAGEVRRERLAGSAAHG